jgi:carbon monoxide dehydrogenase subunit G
MPVDLMNTFTVNLPVEDAWRVLTDLERVAPCLPGAALLSVEGDDYRGAVKIKVGPVSAQYKGIARFVERDDKAYRAVIRAEGRDVGGQGNAAATVTATLSEQGAGTKVEILTELALSGRVAQFGRGVIADVSNKLLGQFIQRLEAEVASDGANRDTGARTLANGSAPVSTHDVEPFDVMSSMGTTIAKRALPVAGAVAIVIAGLLFARKGRRQSAGFPHAPGAGWPSAQWAGVPVVINLTLPALTSSTSASHVNNEEVGR